MSIYKVKSDGHGLEAGDSLHGGEYFKANNEGTLFKFKVYDSKGNDKGDVFLLHKWIIQNVEINIDEPERDSEREQNFIKALGRSQSRAQRNEKEKPSISMDLTAPPEKPKKPRVKKTNPKTPSKQNSSTKKIESRRDGSNKNSRKPLSKCVPKNIKFVKPRKPGSPGVETQLQINFLTEFAKVRDNCTCHNNEPDISTTQYDSKDEAEKAVMAFLEEAKNNSTGGKAQKCDAMTILEKDGKYIVLQTNSSPSCVKQKPETKEIKLKKRKKENTNKSEGSEEEEIITAKRLRPIKQLELSGKLEESGARFYAISSCTECDKVEFPNSFTFNPNMEDEEITEKAEKLFTEENKTFNQKGYNAALTLTNKLLKRNKNYRLIRVKKIQPVENPSPTQDGWSLHHSEMETIFYALRRGWTIVKVYIDRDCCVVCGATLKQFAPKVHEAVTIFNFE